MIRHKWASKTEWFLRGASIICGLVVAFCGGLLKAEPSWFGEANSFEVELATRLLAANASIAWVIIPGLTILGGLFSFFRFQIGNKHKWSCVATVLEEFRQSVFNRRKDFEKRAHHHDRVTLFKYVRFRFAPCWLPWTGWMVPVARTGHATVSSKIPRFRAPLDEPGKAEGSAALAFVNNVKVPISDLPDLSLPATEEDIQTYAEKGLVPIDWVRKRIKDGKDCPSRALLGVPIEVKGEKWGAIVIDSRDPDEIEIDDKQWKEKFRILNKVLSKLLED